MNKQLFFWGKRLLFLIILLILPTLAARDIAASMGEKIVPETNSQEQGIFLPLLLIYITVITLLTIWFYAADKRKAVKRLWRVPESFLHLLSLLGGWGGAYFSQQVFRHKNRKLTFQIVFWAIVTLHLTASFEILSENLIIRTLFSND